ncbi:MAG: sigma-70 family RNA polymerase sigma factor [Eubacteriaceae bacterium]|nr:sigma-70 family RNA polymerase sigma factor [Eubacteriaceae bacterium]
MDDKDIIELYFARSEDAIAQTDRKYRQYLFKISYTILSHSEESMECLNDTYLRAWNTIPPTVPDKLSVYLGKIIRNLSLDRFRRNNASKRFPSDVMLSIEELSEAVPSEADTSKIIDDIFLTEVLNSFLGSLKKRDRIIFVKKYWHLYSVKDISKQMGITEAAVKMSLLRTRNKLRERLRKEDITI